MRAKFVTEMDIILWFWIGHTAKLIGGVVEGEGALVCDGMCAIICGFCDDILFPFIPVRGNPFPHEKFFF
jgi:hypothetical protein